jgi:hypothetical protein
MKITYDHNQEFYVGAEYPNGLGIQYWNTGDNISINDDSYTISVSGQYKGIGRLSGYVVLTPTSFDANDLTYSIIFKVKRSDQSQTYYSGAISSPFNGTGIGEGPFNIDFTFVTDVIPQDEDVIFTVALQSNYPGNTKMVVNYSNIQFFNESAGTGEDLAAWNELTEVNVRLKDADSGQVISWFNNVNGSTPGLIPYRAPYHRTLNNVFLNEGQNVRVEFSANRESVSLIPHFFGSELVITGTRALANPSSSTVSYTECPGFIPTTINLGVDEVAYVCSSTEPVVTAGPSFGSDFEFGPLSIYTDEICPTPDAQGCGNFYDIWVGDQEGDFTSENDPSHTNAYQEGYVTVLYQTVGEFGNTVWAVSSAPANGSITICSLIHPIVVESNTYVNIVGPFGQCGDCGNAGVIVDNDGNDTDVGVGKPKPYIDHISGLVGFHKGEPVWENSEQAVDYGTRNNLTGYRIVELSEGLKGAVAGEKSRKSCGKKCQHTVYYGSTYAEVTGSTRTMSLYGYRYLVSMDTVTDRVGSDLTESLKGMFIRFNDERIYQINDNGGLEVPEDYIISGPNWNRFHPCNCNGGGPAGEPASTVWCRTPC